MMGGEARRFLIFSNAVLAFSVQVKDLVDLLSSWLCAISFDKEVVRRCSSTFVSRNCLIHTSRPIKLWSSFLVVGGDISVIALVYSGSALNPSWSTIRPRNFASGAMKVHFSGFNFSPNSRRALNSC